MRPDTCTPLSDSFTPALPTFRADRIDCNLERSKRRALATYFIMEICPGLLPKYVVTEVALSNCRARHCWGPTGKYEQMFYSAGPSPSLSDLTPIVPGNCAHSKGSVHVSKRGVHVSRPLAFGSRCCETLVRRYWIQCAISNTTLSIDILVHGWRPHFILRTPGGSTII